MTGGQPCCWSVQRWKLGAVLLGLFALAGAVFLWHSTSQAGSSPHTLSLQAFFPQPDKLQVAVTLASSADQELAGTLQVDLIDKDGEAIHSLSRKVRQQGKLASYRFDFAVRKDQAQHLKVRTRFAGKSQNTPLSTILLAKAHETTLTAGKEFFTGSPTALHCQVQGIRSLTDTVPLPGAAVVITLRAKDKVHKLWTGKTGANGDALAQFKLPNLPAGTYTLEVVTKSALGEETLKQDVRVRADTKILLVTDKPIYQPGQVMHIRALTLQPFDLRPVANADVLFEVEDGKGNKVFKKSLKTSEFGVTAVDFQLAAEVNMGNYQIRASTGEAQAEKTVQVKRYVLPKFKVEVLADRKFYMPKETIKGSLQADYFFGKPIARGQVEIKASTFDVQFRDFQTWKGKTDANGHVKFEIQLPNYFVGQPLQKGDAIVKLEVNVTDSADHTEKVNKSYPVSDQPIRISLIPEGGKLVPGMKNRVFVAAIYPDGSPAECTVKLWTGVNPPPQAVAPGFPGGGPVAPGLPGRPGGFAPPPPGLPVPPPAAPQPAAQPKAKPVATLKTNKVGLAEFVFTPDAKQFRQGNWGQQKVEMLGGQQFGWGPEILLDVLAEAKDKKGNSARVQTALNAHPLGENVLLRLDKAIYAPGDSLAVDVRTSAGLPTVYLDIVRGGQILLSRWLTVKDGQAEHRLDLPPEIFGSLEIHAYQMLTTGEIIRDSRVVYVQPKNDLKVKVQASKTVYAPGENGRIHFVVTDAAGKPATAALGIIIVDEAVYALQDLHPGLEKVYFTLQKELLEPSVQAKFQPNENMPVLIQQPILPPAKQQVAQALLAGAKINPPPAWQVAPAFQRQQQVRQQVQQIGWSLWNAAWNNQNIPVLQVNKAGKVAFNDNALDQLVKTRQIPENFRNGPFGEKLNLNELARVEKHFTPDNLARSITWQRLNTLSSSVAQYANQHKDKYFKNGKWALNQGVLALAAKQFHGANAGRFTHDAWGRPFRLVARDQKDIPAPLGQPVFQKFEIVSSGPDGKVGTRDDISLSQPNAAMIAGANWWMNEEQAAQVNRNLFRRGVNGQPMLAEARMAMPGMAGGGGPGGPPMPMAAPGAMPPMAAPGPGGVPNGGGVPQNQQASGQQGQGGAAPPKVRDYFPETMLWQPALITDEDGKADLAVNFADSITTWRLSASASSRFGGLGGGTTALKVFQDFFVDIDLPVDLTQGDELAFPVAVYNYLSTPQTVTIKLEKGDWYQLVGGGGLTRELKLQPNEVTSVKFRIRADRVGNHPLTVMAYGSKKSDAVKRVVEVVPNGQKKETVLNDRLAGTATRTITIPQDAVPDSYKLLVRIYPGVMSQVVEGTEGMMRMPNGCFEQTSSSAYPNVLIVDYIKKNKLANPEILLKAENYLNVGYQRLLTFERPGGGFDWWGSGEPLIWLSAYGLQEFSDMAKVWPVDRGIIDRTQNFLMKKMDADGTWSKIGDTHSETIASMGNPKLLLTSYVTWSLLDSGLAKNKLDKSVAYIRNNIKDAGDNAYVLAVAANALASYDPKDDSTLQVLQKLEGLRQDVFENKGVRYASKTISLTYARGESVNVETTALTALAMLRCGQFTNSVNKALFYLTREKGSNGTWGSTSATILSLKALVASVGSNQHKGETPFTILVNGKEVGSGKITEANADMMQVFDLQEVTQLGENKVEIRAKGETNLMYQIVGRHYEKWTDDAQPARKKPLAISVTYDRTQLSTTDTLKAKATLRNQGDLEANMVMIDLGIAPGFMVDPGDFAEMVGKKHVNRFTLTPSQVTLYLGNVKPGEVLNFEYTLRAKFPLRAQTPPSTAWEYYTPTNRAVAAPVRLTVADRKK